MYCPHHCHHHHRGVAEPEPEPEPETRTRNPNLKPKPSKNIFVYIVKSQKLHYLIVLTFNVKIYLLVALADTFQMKETVQAFRTKRLSTAL